MQFPLRCFPMCNPKISWTRTTCCFFVAGFPISPWRQTCLEHIHPSYPQPPRAAGSFWERPFDIIPNYKLNSPPSSFYMGIFFQHLKTKKHRSLFDMGSPLLRSFVKSTSLKHHSYNRKLDMFVTSVSIDDPFSPPVSWFILDLPPSFCAYQV